MKIIAGTDSVLYMPSTGAQRAGSGSRQPWQLTYSEFGNTLSLTCLPRPRRIAVAWSYLASRTKPDLFTSSTFTTQHYILTNTAPPNNSCIIRPKQFTSTLPYATAPASQTLATYPSATSRTKHHRACSKKKHIARYSQRISSRQHDPRRRVQVKEFQ